LFTGFLLDEKRNESIHPCEQSSPHFSFVCADFLNHIGHLAKRGFTLWGGRPDTPGAANRALKTGAGKD
jgi:hypothetical protein